jgi:hypothetical protein
MESLEVTISGQPFPHLFYHSVLSYSNWETAVLCFSESFESLSHGLQSALWELGGVPRRHRTDRLSAAVQNPSDRQEFTDRYQRLMDHYSLTGEKTNASSPHENGDVEQSHYRFKQSLDQALLLRGSRDFEHVDKYLAFVRQVLDSNNANRTDRFAEEQKELGRLPSDRLDHRKRVRVSVNKCSLIRVDRNVYSVPSRLIGETVNVLIDVDELQVIYGQQLVERIPRLRGRGKSRVNYRHMIDWLVRKPGAFENYRYQADLFPTTRFRMAYDNLLAAGDRTAAIKTYLGILHLAAHKSEQYVDDVLRILLDCDQPLTVDLVQSHLDHVSSTPAITEVMVEPTRLADFDSLFSSMEVWNHDGPCDRDTHRAAEGLALAGLPGSI